MVEGGGEDGLLPVGVQRLLEETARVAVDREARAWTNFVEMQSGREEEAPGSEMEEASHVSLQFQYSKKTEGLSVCC